MTNTPKWVGTYIHVMLISTLAVIGAAKENVISWWWLPAPIVIGMALLAAGAWTWAYICYLKD